MIYYQTGKDQLEESRDGPNTNFASENDSSHFVFYQIQIVLIIFVYFINLLKC